MIDPVPKDPFGIGFGINHFLLFTDFLGFDDFEPLKLIH